MFERVVFLLLQGAFICRVSHPEAFEYLSNDGNLAAAEEFFGKIGRNVARTSKQSGFFLAFAHYGETERAAIRDNYAEIKNVLTPVVAFFNLVMRITGQEDILMFGTAIEVDTLLGKIDQDISLRNELQSLGARYRINSTDASQRKLLDHILKRLVNDGYLKLANAERSIYQVTAKIEYLLDVIRFIHESDETIKVGDEQADSENNMTGRLL